MLIIDDVVVTDAVTQGLFACDLLACKGACCVEGDAGAPLEEEEAHQLEEHLDAIAPHMDAVGLAEARRQGVYEVDGDGDLCTTTVGGRECVFAKYLPSGILTCAVEEAHRAGDIGFMKPISCHLYPVRVERQGPFEHLVYHHWDICSPACRNGRELGIRVYSFVKDALIRKYGEVWYQALAENADEA